MKRINTLKLLYFFFCLSFGYSFAQTNYRFVYELTFKPNSKKDSLVKENYLLDVYPKESKSKFYSYNYYRNDSLMNAYHTKSEREGGVNIDIGNLPKVKYPLAVSISDGKTEFYETFNGDAYKVVEEKKPVWKISSETKQIKNWKSQKATTEFGGRKWTAWFSNEFPIAEGPYKFKNLPGLVTEIADETGSFKFSLEGVSKITEEFFPFIYKDAIPVSKEKLAKALNNYYLDPGAKLREGILVDDGGTVFHINGGFSKKFIDERTEEARKKLKNFDNKIEISQ